MAPIEANGNNLLLGRGKLYFNRNDAAGSPTGLRFLGDCKQFEITPTVEQKQRYSSTKNSATLLAKNVVTQTHTVHIQMGEYDPENMALALLGDTASFTQAGTAVTGEVLSASVKLGRFYQTANRKITAVTVKKGVTALVLDTDYQIQDAELGLIYIMPTSVTVVDGDNITIDYTPTAVTTPGLTQVQAGKEAKIEGELLFIGDPTNGPAFDAEIWVLRIAPNGALALINDDYANIPLTGEILDDSANHPTAPLYQITKRV